MDGEYSRHDQLETILQDSNSEPQDLSLAYLKKITNEFANELLLGEGGFGKVYKGVLQNGRIVAVKKLFQLKPGLQAKQFENEVYHLMRLKHPNIVRFVGYCYETRNECVEFNGQLLFAEKQQRLLCLEYLSNGSLDRHLSDESSGLDWGTRYKIIKGICCGIHYLHEGCKYQINGSIIHLDLKPANILLDDNMVPKVADFGLSRLFNGTKTQTCTANLAGTFGYMAPEYIYGHVITTKADIYSLGVLIIEIITGDRSDPFSFNGTSSEDFLEAVVKKWRNRLEDAPLETDCNQIKLCLQIGLRCFKVDRNERPTAKEIIDILNEWERRNSVDKHKLVENTNCYHNSSKNGDALPVPSSADNGREGGRGVAAILSEALFDQMLPHRNDAACPARGFYTYDAFVAAAGAFPAFGTTGDLDTQKREIAAFLAQTSYETSGGWLTAPDGPYSWGYCYKEECTPRYDYCHPGGPYPGVPGKKYHGRGPMQISYNYNYGAAGQAIGVDLLNNPDLVTTDATVSFKTAIWFWMTPQPPKPSCHAVITGQWSPSSADMAAGREPGYGLIIDIINGGLECGHGPDMRINDRIGFYKRYCDILGISYGTKLNTWQLNCYEFLPLQLLYRKIHQQM